MPRSNLRQSSLQFDRRTGRYRNREGRFVTQAAVRRSVDRIVEETRQDLRRLTTDLIAGKINTADWLIQSREALRSAHTLAGGLPFGGRAQLSQADLGRIGAATRVQYQYLDRFASEIDNGKVPSLGRVDLYARAVRTTFQNATTAAAKDRGVRLARWIRTAQESCAGCSQEAGRGIQALDEFPPIGSNECLSNCLCFIELVAA